MGFTSFEQVDLISLAELDLAMRVVRDKQLDKYEDLHLGAWLGLAAKSTTGGKKPKYKFDKFSKFFDRSKFEGGKADLKDAILESRIERMKKSRAKKLSRKEESDGEHST